MRWISLEGAVNVRDVGGLATTDGSVTAEGQLLRSDNLQGLSAADVRYLVDDLHLSTVIDLRTEVEVESEGPGPLTEVASVEHVHLSVLPPATDINRRRTIEKALLTEDAQEAATEPDDLVLARHYLEYLVNRPDSIVGALRAIAGAPGSAIVHCAAGKDRTGVVMALAELAVGVTRDEVMADYAATGERIEGIMARLRASPTYAKGLDRLTLAQHTPRAGSLQHFLDLVEEEYGSATEYLAANGFGADDLERLRKKLLVDP